MWLTDEDKGKETYMERQTNREIDGGMTTDMARKQMSGSRDEKIVERKRKTCQLVNIKLLFWRSFCLFVLLMFLSLSCIYFVYFVQTCREQSVPEQKRQHNPKFNRAHPDQSRANVYQSHDLSPSGLFFYWPTCIFEACRHSFCPQNQYMLRLLLYLWCVLTILHQNRTHGCYHAACISCICFWFYLSRCWDILLTTAACIYLDFHLQ